MTTAPPPRRRVRDQEPPHVVECEVEDVNTRGIAYRDVEENRTREYVNRQGVAVTVVDSGRKDAGQGKVKKPRGRSLATPLGPQVRVQTRDLWWLEQVLKYKYLSYTELAAWTGCTYKVAANRCAKHIKAGFFDAWRVQGSETIVTATRRSAIRYDLDWLLPKSLEPKPLTLLHTSAVNRLALWLWNQDQQSRDQYILTEREVRAAFRDPEATYLVQRDAEWNTLLDPAQWVVPDIGGFTYTPRQDGSRVVTGGYRMPDLTVLRRGQKSVAVEVELSSKEQSAYIDLFTTYLSAEGQQRFAGVQYYCSSRQVASEVRRAVAKVKGADAFIKIDQFPDSMPLPITRTVRVTGLKLPVDAL